MTSQPIIPREAFRYIVRIRNEKKRNYAWAYARHLYAGEAEPHNHSLSYMGAQAVRLTLHEIHRQSA